MQIEIKKMSLGSLPLDDAKTEKLISHDELMLLLPQAEEILKEIKKLTPAQSKHKDILILNMDGIPIFDVHAQLVSAHTAITAVKEIDPQLYVSKQSELVKFLITIVSSLLHFMIDLKDRKSSQKIFTTSLKISNLAGQICRLTDHIPELNTSLLAVHCREIEVYFIYKKISDLRVAELIEMIQEIFKGNKGVLEDQIDFFSLLNSVFIKFYAEATQTEQVQLLAWTFKITENIVGTFSRIMFRSEDVLGSRAGIFLNVLKHIFWVAQFYLDLAAAKKWNFTEARAMFLWVCKILNDYDGRFMIAKADLAKAPNLILVFAQANAPILKINHAYKLLINLVKKLIPQAPQFADGEIYAVWLGLNDILRKDSDFRLESKSKPEPEPNISLIASIRVLKEKKESFKFSQMITPSNLLSLIAEAKIIFAAYPKGLELSASCLKDLMALSKDAKTISAQQDLLRKNLRALDVILFQLFPHLKLLPKTEKFFNISRSILALKKNISPLISVGATEGFLKFSIDCHEAITYVNYGKINDDELLVFFSEILAYTAETPSFLSKSLNSIFDVCYDFINLFDQVSTNNKELLISYIAQFLDKVSQYFLKAMREYGDEDIDKADIYFKTVDFVFMIIEFFLIQHDSGTFEYVKKIMPFAHKAFFDFKRYFQPDHENLPFLLNAMLLAIDLNKHVLEKSSETYTLFSDIINAFKIWATPMNGSVEDTKSAAAPRSEVTPSQSNSVKKLKKRKKKKRPPSGQPVGSCIPVQSDVQPESHAPVPSIPLLPEPAVSAVEVIMGSMHQLNAQIVKVTGLVKGKEKQLSTVKFDFNQKKYNEQSEIARKAQQSNVKLRRKIEKLKKSIETLRASLKDKEIELLQLRESFEKLTTSKKNVEKELKATQDSLKYQENETIKLGEQNQKQARLLGANRAREEKAAFRIADLERQLAASQLEVAQVRKQATREVSDLKLQVEKLTQKNVEMQEQICSGTADSKKINSFWTEAQRLRMAQGFPETGRFQLIEDGINQLRLLNGEAPFDYRPVNGSGWSPRLTATPMRRVDDLNLSLVRFPSK